jgi:flagellar basal-body rod protein FlgB
MSNSIDNAFAFQSRALALSAYRQQILASNIANADTPNYKARDIDFAAAMRNALSAKSLGMTKTSAGHLDAAGGGSLAGVKPLYRASVQPSVDGNTVDADVEQAKFAENSLQYLATLQFMNGDIHDLSLAIKGS